MDDKDVLQEIKNIYDEYLADIVDLEKERKPTDGLLGFGKRADYDPCHTRFSDKLESALNSLTADKPSSLTTGKTLMYIYETAEAYKNNSLVYWMLLAVHELTAPVIKFLTPEDAAKLAKRYTEIYPYYVRLPNQEKIAKQLYTQAGMHEKKGLSALFGKHGR